MVMPKNRPQFELSVHRIKDWFTLSDYYAAKAKATRQIIARQSRGNVAVQNGWFLTRADLLKKSRKADKAMRELEKAVR